MEYDPLLAKLCAWASTREAATQRLDRALAEYTLTGVRTNLSWFREILADEEFQKAHLTTAFLEDFTKRRPALSDNLEAEAAAALVLALGPLHTEPRPSGSGLWQLSHREASLR
jgi:acetyl/propionyl-CoA carboxylase alpha subunit